MSSVPTLMTNKLYDKDACHVKRYAQLFFMDGFGSWGGVG
jgi:hypothetical protein